MRDNKEQVFNRVIKIFDLLGYKDIKLESQFRKDIKNLGMVTIGRLSDEIEYEFSITISISDIKTIFKGTIGDLVDWIYVKMLVKECD
jgi:acyl carrier protein